MNFLFEATIHDCGEELRYNVYQFKLQPDRYKAELTSGGIKQEPSDGIILWKRRSTWKTNSHFERAIRVATIIGWNIDHRTL